MLHRKEPIALPIPQPHCIISQDATGDQLHAAVSAPLLLRPGNLCTLLFNHIIARLKHIIHSCFSRSQLLFLFCSQQALEATTLEACAASPRRVPWMPSGRMCLALWSHWASRR